MRRKKITVYLVTILCFSLFMFTFIFNSDAMASKTGKVTASSLNVRTGAGTSYSKLKANGKAVQLKKGTTVTILSEKSGWYKVSFTYNKKTLQGYVSKEYIGSVKSSASAKTTTTKTGTVNTETLRVRKGAGTTYAQLTDSGKKVSLKQKAKVVIYSEKNGWYYISFTFNKKTLKGYVSKQYIKVDSTSTATTTTTSTSTKVKYKIAAKTRDALKVRKAAGTSATQLTYNKVKVVLKKSQSIYIRNEAVKDGKMWYYVSFTYSGKTMYGWVAGDYVQLTLKSNVNAHIRTSSVTMLKSTTTKLQVSGKNVALTKNTNLVITKETYTKGLRYYYVTFTYKNKTYKGYIKPYYVLLGKYSTSSSTPAATPTPTPKPTPTPTPKPTTTPSATPNTTVLSKSAFTKKMSAEGFPTDYIESLYAIHQKHPAWVFKTYKTNIAWSTAVSKQTASKGKASVYTSQNKYQWLSDAIYAYNMVEDNPYIVDGTLKSGSAWFTASATAVKYYMDPRNFLNEKSIFMFETLGYDKTSHTKAIVQGMVAGTPLAGSFSYNDSDGNKVTMSYVDAIMDAANYSDVSPIHLVARMKQEILASSGGNLVFSGSVTGKYTGYTGLYNFFNIGASDSSSGQAIANGLKYAKNGGSDATLNAKMFIPWDNPYKAIMGGAKFIASGYIEKGQDTSYFQKFNVTSYSTHTHQYMTNIQAPASEATKTYSGYSSVNALNTAIVFTIPIYTSMSTTPNISPDSVGTLDKANFNNYLKDCVIANGTTQYASLAKKNFSYITYEPSYTINAAKISIKPTVAGAGAKISSMVAKTKSTGAKKTITSGTSFDLSVGVTEVEITVQSANGKTRVYTITITRTK